MVRSAALEQMSAAAGGQIKYFWPTGSKTLFKDDWPLSGFKVGGDEFRRRFN